MPATATCLLESQSPYSQSAPIFEKKASDETDDQFEERIWRMRAHVDEKGTIVIPPTAFATCIKNAANKLGLKIPGKRGATYGKYFAGGIIVDGPIRLEKHRRDSVLGEPVYVFGNPNNPKSGRVWRIYPKIDHWSAEIAIAILDPIITEEVLRETLTYAGRVVGIGRYRPENRGWYGRFAVERLTWQKS